MIWPVSPHSYILLPMLLSDYCRFISFPDIKFQFTADITFGTPSKKCENFGICRIDPLGLQKDSCCQDCEHHRPQAIITVCNEFLIELAFLKFSVSPRDYITRFSNGIFVVEEAYIYADDHSEAYFHITPGEYPIAEDGSFLRILFHQQLSI